jgi:hypothetical protein
MEESEFDALMAEDDVWADEGLDDDIDDDGWVG